MPQENGLVAIVTGGASGIGLATTGALLAEGWRVVSIDRDADAITAAEASLQADAGRLRLAQADVTDEAGIAAVVAETERDFGPIRGLVTCAGIARNAPFLETSAEDFRKIYNVNVVGTFITAREVAARMRATGGGAIVTISSVSGLTGNLERAAYGASKGAVVNLTRIMAVELAAFGIRVNSVAPGPIETPMVAAHHTPAIREIWHERVLMKRYGAPEEIAQSAAFLLDDKRAGYITGQILAVDGGFTTAGLIAPSRKDTAGQP